MRDSDKSRAVEFPKEKEYRIGSQAFNVRREYCGGRKMNEIIADIIVKKEMGNNG